MRIRPRLLASLAAGLSTACAAPAARASGSGGGGAVEVVTLVTAHRFTGDAPRADPDQPALRYALHGLRWKAMAGDSVVLAGVTSDALRIGLSLDGFIELVNFDTGFPVPWQSYRANIGFNLLAESPRLSRALLPAGGRLQISLGWFHESDHVADLDSYLAQYVSPRVLAAGAWFDNGDFSSYEYIKLRAAVRQPLLGGRLTTMAALGARVFPKTIDPYSIRALRASALAEARVTARVTEGVRPFVSAYFELLESGFSAREEAFSFGLERAPLRYAIVNLGVDLVSRSGSIVSLFASYSRSHGRGVDFPRFFGPEGGFGIALLP